MARGGLRVRALSRALLAALLVVASAALAEEPRIALPPGFRITEFASGFGSPRFMTLDPAGTLLVSTPRQGRVVALPDRDGDGRADAVVTVADGLDLPHGLAFKDGQLWVAETGRVRRFRYDPATLKASDPVVVVPNLPPGGGHWTRTIAFGPDGRLYASVGSSCNVCREADPRRAAITRYNADGSGAETVATGVRNAVGLAFRPGTGELWATINERDWRGDDLPPDYITEIKDGGFYGWPECFAAGGKIVPDPTRRRSASPSTPASGSRPSTAGASSSRTTAPGTARSPPGTRSCACRSGTAGPAASRTSRRGGSRAAACGDGRWGYRSAPTARSISPRTQFTGSATGRSARADRPGADRQGRSRLPADGRPHRAGHEQRESDQQRRPVARQRQRVSPTSAVRGARRRRPESAPS